jgi:hypothetical protein
MNRLCPTVAPPAPTLARPHEIGKILILFKMLQMITGSAPEPVGRC